MSAVFVDRRNFASVRLPADVGAILDRELRITRAADPDSEITRTDIAAEAIREWYGPISHAANGGRHVP